MYFWKFQSIYTQFTLISVSNAKYDQGLSNKKKMLSVITKQFHIIKQFYFGFSYFVLSRRNQSRICDPTWMEISIVSRSLDFSSSSRDMLTWLLSCWFWSFRWAITICIEKKMKKQQIFQYHWFYNVKVKVR